MELRDQLVSSRRRVLMGILIGFSVWQVADLADRFGAATLSRSMHNALGAITLVGVLIYLASLIWLAPMTKLIKANPALRESLNDELVQHLRLKASSFGFGAAMAVQVVPIVASIAGAPLAGVLVARLTLFVGVAAALGAFLVFERG